MANSFTFNGISSLSFGIRIQKKNIFDSPVPEQTFQPIPGRDGDIILKGSRLQNVTVSYTCFIKKNNIADLSSAIKSIKAWLYSACGKYAELTDSYEPQYFRNAALCEALQIEEQFNKLGIFTVSFNCQPYKYSFAGQTEVRSSTGTLTVSNPEAFESKPLIYVTGSGAFTLTVSGENYATEITVENTGSTSRRITFDTEKMAVYTGSQLLTYLCAFSNGFPVFRPGQNTVQISESGVTEISAIPRWRTL